MKRATDIGRNLTGVATAPLRAEEAIEGAREGGDGAAVMDGAGIRSVRAAYMAQAEPVGTMPLPGNVRGLTKAAAGMLRGVKPTVLLDRMGGRLAFERTGVRLYEAVLSKLEAHDRFEGGPTRVELEHNLADERAHFDLLRRAIEEIGGDPTALTPSGDLAGVVGHGVLQIVADPRADLLESLEALRMAELAENDGWEDLARLAVAAGHEQLVGDFQRAIEDEARHLDLVREWIAAGNAAELGVSQGKIEPRPRARRPVASRPIAASAPAPARGGRATRPTRAARSTAGPAERPTRERKPRAAGAKRGGRTNEKASRGARKPR